MIYKTRTIKDKEAKIGITKRNIGRWKAKAACI